MLVRVPRRAGRPIRERALARRCSPRSRRTRFWVRRGLSANAHRRPGVLVEQIGGREDEDLARHVRMLLIPAHKADHRPAPAQACCRARAAVYARSASKAARQSVMNSCSLPAGNVLRTSWLALTNIVPVVRTSVTSGKFIVEKTSTRTGSAPPFAI